MAYNANTLSSVKKGMSSGKKNVLSYLTNDQLTAINAQQQAIADNATQNNGGFLGGIGYTFEKLGLGFLQSIEGIWDYTAGGLAELFGAHDWAEKQMANDWVNYGHADEWYNPSDGWKFVGDVAGGIGTSLPAILTVAAAAGIAVASGGTLSALSAGMIGGVVAGLGAAGTATKDAYRETGQLTGKEWGYGTLSGFTEGAMEGVSDALGFGVGTVVKNLTKSTAKSVARQTLGKTMIKGFLGEAFEEGVQELIDPIWKRLTYDPNAQNATAQQVGYAALVGGLSGAIMSGGDVSIRNSISYFSGSKINANGGANGVIDLAETIAQTEGENHSGNEQVEVVVNTLNELKESLKKTNGNVQTAKQKMLVGILNKANTYAPLSIVVNQNADAIVENAEATVKRLNDIGYKTSTGESVTVEKLLNGLDTNAEKGTREYRKALSAAMRNNEVLRTAAVMSAAGRLTMDAARFQQQTLRGETMFSQADLSHFKETATDAQKRDVGERLGVQDWNSITEDELKDLITEYSRSGLDQYLKELEEIKQLGELEISSNSLPRYVGSIKQDGAVRYKFGNSSVAIVKKGNTYLVYDYANDVVSKPLNKAEANRVIKEIYTASVESAVDSDVQTESQKQTQEIDAFARENIPDYNKIVGAQQQAVRETLRQARAAGISEADQILYGRVAARSGAVIEFVSSESLGAKADAGYSLKSGKILVNREVANNPNARTTAKILLHEFTHAMIAGGYTIKNKKGKPHVKNKVFNDFFNAAIKGLSTEQQIEILTPYVENHDVSMQDFLDGKVDLSTDTYIELREELAANFVEKELGKSAALERILSDKPSFKDKLLSFLKRAKSDYSSNEKLSRAANALLKKYQKFFNQHAAQNRFSPTITSNLATYKNKKTTTTADNSTETIRFATMNNKSFKENVADILQMSDDVALKNQREANFVSIMKETPSVIMESVADSENLEIIIRFDALYLAARSSGALQGHYHSLGAETLNNLPNLISDPDAIIRLPNGRLNLLTQIKTKKGNNGLISIELNTVKDINSKYNKYNLVVSVFSAKDTYTRNVIMQDGVSVAYKKVDLAQVNPQLYEWLAIINDKSTTNSISNSEENVNTNDRKSNNIRFALEKDGESGYNNKKGAESGNGKRNEANTRATETNEGSRRSQNIRGGRGRVISVFNDRGTVRQLSEITQNQKTIKRVEGFAEEIYTQPRNETQENLRWHAGYEDIAIYFAKKLPNCDKKAVFDGKNIIIDENASEQDLVDILNKEKPITREIDPNKVAHISEERWSKFIQANPDAYLTRIPIQQFLDMTTESYVDQRQIYARSTQISREASTSNIRNTSDSFIYLEIDLNAKKVIDHEGRHRMTALLNAGNAYADVFVKLVNGSGIESYGNIKVQGQFNVNKHNLGLVRANSSKFAAAIENVFRTDDGNIRYALRQNSSKKQNVDIYTESQYNNFGWVRANDVLTANQWADFNAKFSQAKHGGKFVKTAKGEYIIPVNNGTKETFGIDNILVFAQGTINTPKVSRIIGINLEFETVIDDLRREIYAREQMSWTRSSDFYANLYETGLVREYTARDIRNYQDYKAEIRQRGRRQESGGVDGNNQSLSNGRGNTQSNKRDIRFALAKPDTNTAVNPTESDNSGAIGGLTRAQRAKFVANNTKFRVYSKLEAASVIDSIIAERLTFEDGRYEGVLKGKNRAEVIEKLFIKLNSTPEGYRTGVALDIADYIINNAVLSDMYETFNDDSYAMGVLSIMRSYMHRVDLSGIQSEIQHRFDKKNRIAQIWGTKTGGITPDVIAQELQSNGISIEAMSAADQFFEMLQIYENAREQVNKKTESIKLTAIGSETEIEQLRQEIARDVLKAYDEKGTQSKYAKLVEKYTNKIADLKKDLSTAYKRNTLTNRIIDGAAYLRDIANKRNYVGAEVFTAPELTLWLKQLGKLKYRSDLRKSGVRKILLDYGQFYNTSNTLLYDDNPDLSYIDNNVIDALNLIRQNALSSKPLSMEELQAAQVIIDSAKHLFNNYDQIRIEGKKARISELASAGNEIIKKSKNRTSKSFFNKIYSVFNKIIEPRVVIESLENFNPNGILTRAYNEVTRGETEAGLLYIELTNDIDTYLKKHKRFKKRLTSEYITVGEAELTVGQAISLYELSKRPQAIDGLYESGFSYIDKKGSKQTARITPTNITALQNAFTDVDKGFIDIVESFYNVASKQVKTDADMQILGYTNTSEEFYYPIKRDSGTIARNITDARSMMADWANVYNFSFNKDVKTGAKNKLFIEDAYSIITRHAKQLSTYAKMTVPLKNFSQIYAKNIGDKTNVISIRNTINEQVWGGAEGYLSKLFSDIQGRATSSSIIEKMRGAYAKYQLGANLKVVVSQITSYPTAGILLDTGVMAKGFVMKTNWSAMDRYCPYARVRNYERGVIKAEGVIDKIGKVGDVLTKPIQWTDRFTIGRLWNACQLQVQKDTGLKLGSVENMQKAGDMLEEVIRLTQPNYTNTERSELMRSDRDIVRSFTMFASVPLKQLSRLVESFGEFNALHSLIKSGDTDATLSSRYKLAKKKLCRTLAAVTVANLMYVLVGQFFKFLYNDMAEDDEEGKVTAQSVFLDMLKDFGSTTIGMLPIVRDIYGYFMNGYEINNFAFDMLNSIVGSTKELFELATKSANGENISTQDYMKAFRNSLYSIGQIAGIPFRNLNNTLTGLVKRFNTSAAYSYTSLFYNHKYSTDIKAALKKGDYELAETIMGMMLKDDRTGGLSSKATKKMIELYDAGYTILPKSIGDTLTYNNETIQLTAEQRKAFKAVYSQANAEIEKLVNSAAFVSLPAEQQAKAIKLLYDAYYSKAQASVLKLPSSNNIIMLSKAIPPSTLATQLAAISAIESDTDKKGNVVNGSKKAKIIKYVMSQKLSTAQKLLLILALGYTIKDGDVKGVSAAKAKSTVAQYITKLSLSREEKTALAVKCGLTVKNGRIYVK